MKVKFNKGDTVVATNITTNEIFTFICMNDGSCQQMLRRYVCLRLCKGNSTDKFLFTKQ